jgi:hypothetical protein
LIKYGAKPGLGEGGVPIEFVKSNRYCVSIFFHSLELLEMNICAIQNSRNALNLAKPLGVILMLLCMLALVGCFSSTKVYQTDKTIAYDGSLYNMSNVQKIEGRIEGRLPNGDTRNMKGMSKKEVNALLDEGSPIMVTTAIDMDSQELVYERRSVSKYSEFSKMVNKFESAGKDVSKFMANKKSTQLKLK